MTLENNNKVTTILGWLVHEIRTPLTAIKGFASILEGNDCTEDERKKFLSIINWECKRLELMLENISDFDSLISGENISIRKQDNTDICYFGRSCLEIQKIFAKSNQILKEDFSHTSIKINTDPEKLCQIILILLNNAVKFSPGGGEIILSIKLCDNKAIFSVKDEGIGIPSEKIEDIFGKYERANDHIDGKGIGLFIAKHLVKSLGGEINAESEKDKGTKITFFLPLK